MSPSNNLKPYKPFKRQKVGREWLKQNYGKYLRLMMPAWKFWFEEILKKDAVFCLVIYEDLKMNLIEELRPVINFLGYNINEELEKCILANQEGNYLRLFFFSFNFV